MVKRLQVIGGVQYAWYGQVKEEMMDQKKRVDPMTRNTVGTRFIASSDVSINTFPMIRFANDVYDEYFLFRWINT